MGATILTQSDSVPVHVRGLSKSFGQTLAVDNVSFTAEAGRITTLLGPSGCGKTTTLRAIGGFHSVDTGEIYLGDRRVNGMPAHRRETRTVFQSYALFPHMTVFENVAFGLRATGVRRSEIPGRVTEALRLVGLENFERRGAGALSGGQQQRVAFARALVTRPKVLLLDEPLSNLDAKLRVQMRIEIRRIQQELKITMIYVTHDQEEAMSLSDKVIVMRDARVEQEGLPHEIYERPASRFVAGFIGASNVFPVELKNGSREGVCGEFVIGTERCTLPPPAGQQSSGLQENRTESGLSAAADEGLHVVFRPEHVKLAPVGGTAMTESPTGRVEAVSYLGSVARYIVRVGAEQTIIADDHAPSGASLLSPGSEVFVSFDHSRGHVVRR